MKPLWPHWRKIARKVWAHRKLLLALDFDGTLSPIVSSPARAKLHDSVRSTLRRLKRSPDVHIAILSGRALNDLIPRVGIRSLLYAGNHGFEISGPGVSFTHPEAESHREILASLGRECRNVLKNVPGSLVEEKELSLGLHYRCVPARHLPAFRDHIRRLKQETSALPLKWGAGKKVEEVLPSVAWDKGKAASFLLEKLGFPFPVAVGDDRTDEDMFGAVKTRGLSIHVSPRSDSVADYRLKGQKDVARFLVALEDLLDRRRSGAPAPSSN